MCFLVSCIWHCCIYANAHSQVSAVCHLEGVLSNSRSCWQKNPSVAEGEQCWCPALAPRGLLCAQPNIFQIFRLWNRNWVCKVKTSLHAMSFPSPWHSSTHGLITVRIWKTPGWDGQWDSAWDGDGSPAPAARGGSTQVCWGQLTHMMELQPPSISFHSTWSLF